MVSATAAVYQQIKHYQFKHHNNKMQLKENYLTTYKYIRIQRKALNLRKLKS
jgi:hypothetical protein